MSAHFQIDQEIWFLLSDVPVKREVVSITKTEEGVRYGLKPLFSTASPHIRMHNFVSDTKEGLREKIFS